MGDLPNEDLRNEFFSRVEFSCRPAPFEMIVRKYAEVLLMCATRKQDDFDIELATSAVCERMRYYPADVVMCVLDEWPDNNRFKPTWLDLKEKMDFYSRNRFSMLKSLWNGNDG